MSYDGELNHDQSVPECMLRPIAAPPPVRSEPLLAATIERLAAQFAGYALRVAPNDSGTDAILETINDLRRIAANAPAHAGAVATSVRPDVGQPKGETP